MVKPSTFNTRHSRGFTLVELLVVIGIIAVLMSILLPMVARSLREGKRVAQKQTFQTITVAIEAYHTDYGIYPPVGATNNGANVLYAAIGKDRPGKFDLDLLPAGAPDGIPDSSSSKFPPYIKPDSIKIDSANGVFLDGWDKAILYYGANPVTDVHNTANPLYAAPSGYAIGTANRPRWNTNDNVSALSPEKFRKMSGDNNADGTIGTGETDDVSLPFILWSAGPDGVYGPVNGLSKTDVEKCDDVTNFR